MTLQITPGLDAEAIAKIRERNIAYAKRWRKKNPEKTKRTITCECGSTFIYSNKSNHIRCKKHIQWLKTQQMKQQLRSQVTTN